MNGRAQGLLALALIAAAIVVATLAPPIDPRLPSPAAAGDLRSGLWFCPHGGGEDWRVALQVANPGDSEVMVRVTTFDEDGPGEHVDRTVPVGGTISVDVDATASETSSLVEYFGGWVAAGWVTRAGGRESGVAAEPCSPRTASEWYLPDASTVENEVDSIIVMNPFEADAVFTVTLLTPGREPTRTDQLTNVLVEGQHSTTVRLGRTLLGEATVSSVLTVSVGRVVAALLDITGETGIRSALGYAGMPEPGVVLPGGNDRGRSDLVVMVPGTETVALSGVQLGTGPAQAIPGLAEAQPPGGSARAFPVATAGASALVSTSIGVPTARRSAGAGDDEGSTIGAQPGSAWVVLPTVAGSPYDAAIVVANPGDSVATVTLRPLGYGPSPITLLIPPGTVASAPRSFTEGIGDFAVLVIATSGTVVPVGASSSLGKDGRAGYAVALGVRIPLGDIPA